MSYNKDPKFYNEVQYCEKIGIPLAVTLGKEEKEKGGVALWTIVI